ncbi:hypothetical protein [Methylomonas sp. DH-1]|uniref:hypothetical protein n=1 Tax=Methylomonas sp. (strain DH-1) TaxID=1727196 RepID=UPI0012F6EB15|nr:hypothetical protein [Methylomonas sp. DH-1]
MTGNGQIPVIRSLWLTGGKGSVSTIRHLQKLSFTSGASVSESMTGFDSELVVGLELEYATTEWPQNDVVSANFDTFIIGNTSSHAKKAPSAARRRRKADGPEAGSAFNTSRRKAAHCVDGTASGSRAVAAAFARLAMCLARL